MREFHRIQLDLDVYDNVSMSSFSKLCFQSQEVAGQWYIKYTLRRRNTFCKFSQGKSWKMHTQERVRRMGSKENMLIVNNCIRTRSKHRSLDKKRLNNTLYTKFELP